MKLSSFSVILTFVILMIVGAALLPLVDVGTEPQNQRDNRLVIRCEWPQVSAKIVEQNLTTPIEGMVSALKGVERVSSRSSYGSSEIVVWAKEKVDVAALRFLVTSLLRQSYAKLPKGAGYPVVEGGEVTDGARMHQEQQLLLTYQVNGDMTPEMLKKLVSGNVVRRLQLLDGVAHPHRPPLAAGQGGVGGSLWRWRRLRIVSCRDRTQQIIRQGGRYRAAQSDQEGTAANPALAVPVPPLGHASSSCILYRLSAAQPRAQASSTQSRLAQKLRPAMPP